MRIATYAVTASILSIGACHHPTAHRNGADGARGRTRIVLLGTGTPNAEPDRSGTAIAIVVDDTPYLIDCGPGVVRRANAARKRGIDALRPSNLKHLFITHLHTDHTLGYPDLIFTPWVLERDEPLRVFGPVGTKKMTDHILAAYDEDIRIRVDGLEPANTEGYKVNVTEIQPGVVYRDDKVTVKAFAVRHGSWKHAFGFRFETPDRVIVVSGDTAPTPALVDAARGCDVLLHEVYSQAGFEQRSSIWQRYHASFHTSTEELALIARDVKPGLLVLYHQLFWGATDRDLLREIGQRYSGRVVSGRDLDVY
ncbi:MAG: MBL fold metallo-hydrolase [Planctomycetes bacterium]|nr:MBL fold metallo-hydrolase [Planctomycetota bacterium]